MHSSDLDFAVVDDLARASLMCRSVDPTVHLASRRVARIGPLLELLAFHRSGVVPLAALPDCNTSRTLASALLPDHSGSGEYSKADTGLVGFVTTNRDPYVTGTDAQLKWHMFCRKAQQAAELSLPKSLASGLIGAMIEIEENVHWHSERFYDGVVGFRGTPEDFEFVVADSGIGILNSLRKSPDYTHIEDAGEALKTALQDGQSRLKHVEPGRGYGFHDLFAGLLSLNGALRFRSDDHAFVSDGSSPSLENGILRQQAKMQGFISSVLVRASAI